MKKIKDRYNIEYQLGAGGQATVHRAFDHVTQEHVALKIIKVGDAFDEKKLNMFRREANISFDTNHPHIIKIFDFNTDASKGDTYIAIELCEETLNDYVKHRPTKRLPLHEAIAILKQMSSALQYIHDKDILHRDIKLSNILRRAGSRFVLSDFGLAKGEDYSDLTQSDGKGFRGTEKYAAPEIFKQEGASIQSDVYSLAICFLLIICGIDTKISFYQKVNWREFQALLENKLKHFAAYPNLVQAIFTSLSEDPKDRPQSAEELYIAISTAYELDHKNGARPPHTRDEIPEIEGPIADEEGPTHAYPKTDLFNNSIQSAKLGEDKIVAFFDGTQKQVSVNREIRFSHLNRIGKFSTLILITLFSTSISLWLAQLLPGLSGWGTGLLAFSIFIITYILGTFAHLLLFVQDANNRIRYRSSSAIEQIHTLTSSNRILVRNREGIQLISRSGRLIESFTGKLIAITKFGSHHHFAIQNDNQITIYDAYGSRAIVYASSPNDQPFYVDLCEGKALIATEKRLQVFNLNDSRPPYFPILDLNVKRGILSATIDWKGSKIGVLDKQYQIEIIQIRGAKSISKAASTNTCRKIEFSPHGSILLAQDHNRKLLGLYNFSEKPIYLDNRYRGTQPRFLSPNSQVFKSIVNRTNLKIWHPESKKSLFELNHLMIDDLDYSEEYGVVAIILTDGRVAIWFLNDNSHVGFTSYSIPILGNLARLMTSIGVTTRTRHSIQFGKDEREILTTSPRLRRIQSWDLGEYFDKKKAHVPSSLQEEAIPGLAPPNTETSGPISVSSRIGPKSIYPLLFKLLKEVDPSRSDIQEVLMEMGEDHREIYASIDKLMDIYHNVALHMETLELARRFVEALYTKFDHPDILEAAVKLGSDPNLPDD